MKKSSKILIVILATILLVGVLMLAAFASESEAKGQFLVAGVGYETWEEAVAAANNTHTIYLNEDIELGEGIAISGAGTKVRINLNGKKVSVNPDAVATAFNAQGGSELVITGSGIIDNVKNCVGATGASAVTVEGTGKDGITINHAKTAAGTDVISAFRIHDRATLNITGLITVNGKSGTRNVIHMGSSSGTQGAAALNISNSKIIVPLLTEGYVYGSGSGASEYSKVIVLSDNIDVNITDSDFRAEYGMLIYATGAGGTADVSSYKSGNGWLSTAAGGVKIADPTIRFSAKNTKFFSDYSGYSKKFTASGHNPGASFMGVYAKMDALFDNCIIYSDFRAVTADSNGTITTKKLNQHQLTFNNCHFFDAPGDNTTAPFFLYGANYKIIGGSFSGPSWIGNGSHYYLPLVDGNGEPTGKWAGGYMNNTLLNSSRNFVYEGVTSNWSDSTYVEPDSAKTHDVSLLIDGAIRKFYAGHFTDDDLYYTYVPKVEEPDEPVVPDVPGTPDPDEPTGPVDPDYGVAKDYILYSSSSNTVGVTGDYKKENALAATGTNPLVGGGYYINVDKGITTSVLYQGNGYVKTSFDGSTTNGSSGSSKYNYFATPTGKNGSILTTDAFVFEWDISTDDNYFSSVSYTTQGRMRQPRYAANGSLLGTTNSALADKAMDYAPRISFSHVNNSISFGGKSYTMSTERGEWTRITFILDFDIETTPTEIDVPVYTKSGSTYTAVAGATVKKQAYKVLKYDGIMYVNGEYLNTVPIDPTTIGYNGYIVEGNEANFYVDGIRISTSGTSGRVDSWCVDNVRISQYDVADNVDLGLYENGEPVDSIVGNEHFLIMLDNSTIVPPPITHVIVDGVKYEKDEDALEAIKDGSVIELERPMEKPINVDTILAKLGLETMSFKIIPGSFKMPTIVSSTHGLSKGDVAGEYNVSPLYIVVDGTDYFKEADAIAAIKNGSVIELERNLTTSIDVDALLAKLDIETIKFSIISNGYSVAAINSSTHKMLKDESGKYIVTPIGINVDGVEYGTDAEAIAAIKNGSVVEFNRDMRVAINVDELLANLGVETISFKVIPGNFSFPGIVSESHKIVDYSGTFGGYLVSPAGFGETFSLLFYDELFGYSETLYTVAEGTNYPSYILTEKGDEVAYDGSLWSIVAWHDTTGATAANGILSNNELVIKMVADYTSVFYYYEIAVNGTSQYITDSAFGDNLAAALEAGDVKVVLWRDVTLDSTTSIKGRLDLDLNGSSVTVINASQADSFSVFELAPGAKLNIYSTREGAGISVSDDALLINAEYDRFRAADVNVTLGSEGGQNIAVNADRLINYYDPYIHDSSTGNDAYQYGKNLIVEINGLTLLDNGASKDGGMISSSLPLIVNAKSFSYEGAKSLISMTADERATLDANFKASSFVSTAALLNAPGKNKNSYFEACYIGAPLFVSYEVVEELLVYGEEVITIGEGCSFTASKESLADNKLTIKEGCIVAPANAGEVKCYVDVPENLALITWVDATGAPIGEANYNAPFGKPFEVFTKAEAAEKVGKLVENDWYFISFEDWDIPEDFELTAGNFTIYPAWKAPEASLTCLKLDLVAYTYFKLNMYLPSENLPDGVELCGIYRECQCNGANNHKGDPYYKKLDGKWYVLLEDGAVEMEGQKYNSYTVYPGAADASEPEYKVIFELNGEMIVGTINCGVPTYAEKMMNNIIKEGVSVDDLSEEDKQLASLVMNMVRYANESYKLANPVNDEFPETGVPKYEALLASHSGFLKDLDSISFSDAEMNVDIDGLSECIEGASFIFGEYQPRFIFKYRDSALEYLVKPEASDGRIYTWPEGNKGIFTFIYHENYDGTRSITYIAPHFAYNGENYVEPDIVAGTWGPMTEAYAATVDMSVLNATGIMKVTVCKPDGTSADGSYSLAAYIAHLRTSATAANVMAIEAEAKANEAKVLAELAAAEALKPENAPLRDQYEAQRIDYEQKYLDYTETAIRNAAEYRNNTAFERASLALYAFALASQEYDIVVNK